MVVSLLAEMRQSLAESSCPPLPRALHRHRPLIWHAQRLRLRHAAAHPRTPVAFRQQHRHAVVAFGGGAAAVGHDHRIDVAPLG